VCTERKMTDLEEFKRACEESTGKYATPTKRDHFTGEDYYPGFGWASPETEESEDEECE